LALMLVAQLLTYFLADHIGCQISSL